MNPLPFIYYDRLKQKVFENDIISEIQKCIDDFDLETLHDLKKSLKDYKDTIIIDSYISTWIKSVIELRDTQKLELLLKSKVIPLDFFYTLYNSDKNSFNWCAEQKYNYLIRVPTPIPNREWKKQYPELKLDNFKDWWKENFSKEYRDIVSNNIRQNYETLIKAQPLYYWVLENPTKYEVLEFTMSNNSINNNLFDIQEIQKYYPSFVTVYDMWKHMDLKVRDIKLQMQAYFKESTIELDPSINALFE